MKPLSKLKAMLGIVCNEPPLADEAGWQLLCPYGNYPHKQGLQAVTREAATKLQQACNEDRQRLGASWRGYPIYVGHDTKGPRLGGVMDIRPGAEGPEVQVVYNTSGKTNVAEGQWIYPSPAWYLSAPDVSGKCTPLLLDHIGMTNQPNISEAQVWTNDSNPNTPNTMDTANIAKLLGLAETATEADIIAAITALQADKAAEATTACNAKAEATRLQADVTRLTDAAKAATTLAANERTARIEALLTLAVNELRVSPGELDTQRLAFGADFGAAEAALKARQPALNTKPVTIDRSPQQAGVLAENERQAAIAAWVKKDMATNSRLYNESWAAAQKAPELAAIWAAMAQPKP